MGAVLETSVSCFVSYRVQPPAWCPSFCDPSVAPIRVCVFKPVAIFLISLAVIFLLLASVLMILYGIFF